MEEMMNNEVMENETEVEATDIVPVSEDTCDEDEGLNKGTVAVGIGIMALAGVGVVALGKLAFKGGKAIAAKIKAKKESKQVSAEPVVVEAETETPDTQVQTENEETETK